MLERTKQINTKPKVNMNSLDSLHEPDLRF